MNIIKELSEAIQDHKLEMLNPSRDYSQGEVIFNRGYICGLEAALESIQENNNIIKFSLN